MIIRFKKSWHVRFKGLAPIWHLCGCPGHTSRPHLSQWQAIASCIYSVKRPPKMDLSKVSLLTLTDSEARLFDCFAIFFFQHGFALMMFFPWFSGFSGVPTPVKWKFRTTQASISIRWTIRIRSFGFIDYININTHIQIIYTIITYTHCTPYHNTGKLQQFNNLQLPQLRPFGVMLSDVNPLHRTIKERHIYCLILSVHHICII